ncbi:MAG: TolC family protein [Candidatus Cloacimonetes bacterium]|nr:TolC family protein [Candidatus Cloacimonadota bacterium]
MNNKFIYFGVLLCLLKLSLLSQITLNEAWEIAERNNLSLQNEEISMQISELREKMYKADFLPVIRLNSRASYISEHGNIEIDLPTGQNFTKDMGTNQNYDMSVSLLQPIFTGHRLSNQYRLTQKQTEMAELIRKQRLNEINLAVAEYFIMSEFNHLQQENLKSSQNRVEELLYHLKNLYQNGTALAVDTLEIYTRKLEIENNLLMLDDEKMIIVNNLNYLLNVLSGEDTLSVSNDHDLELMRINSAEEMRIPESDQVCEIAEVNRSELLLINETLETEKFKKKITASGYYPNLYVFAEYHYGNPNVNVTESQWNDYYTAGISMQWEIWNFNKTRRSVQIISKEIEKKNKETEIIKQKIRNQISNSLLNLGIIKKKYENQLKQLELEKKLFQNKRDSYDNGRTSAIELRISEEKLLQSQITLSMYYAEWLRERMKLDFISGTCGQNEETIFFNYNREYRED